MLPSMLQYKGIFIIRGDYVDQYLLRIMKSKEILSTGKGTWDWFNFLGISYNKTSLFFSLIGSFFWSHTRLAIAFSCASLLLGTLNLLPIQTFDGGRMLECALSSFVSPKRTSDILRGCTFLFLWLLWAFSAYLMIKIADGVSLFFFTLTLLARFFEGRTRKKEK